ncbi:MAG: sensor histidine kinase [Rhodobacteraceae bacterium]|nr:sensor histidine kinase [Paracoccaceae bacterium]
MADLAHPLRRRSLLARVLAGVLALLLVGGIVVALAAFAYGHQAARQTYDRLLLGAANDMAEAISVVGGVPVATIPVAAFELLSFSPDDRVTYAVRGPGGDLLTGHEATRAASGMAGADPYYFDGEMQGEKARFVTVVRRFAERDYSGAVSVTVGQTVAARTAMAQGLTRDALIAAAIAGLALVAVAFVVIRSAMRPLDRIAAGLLARDPYDLTPMETNVPGEVAVMIDAMNRFMRRLDRQIAAMRNLISDTAHQLRTPVAAIRAQAELAAEEEDADLRAQGIERLVRRTRSLGSLLDQMLSRALVIHRTDSAPRLPVDLRDIALEVVESRDHELLAPGVEVGLEIGPEPVTVLADAMSLTEAVKNMLTNALRHGKAPVRIGVSEGAGSAEIWVEDSGSGPAPDVLDHIGERFERSAASRGQSAGLGLSIVRAVAEAFGGTLEMQRASAGFRVTLRLPQGGAQ